MTKEHQTRSHALEAATERRVQLKEAVSKAEFAAAAPVDGPTWREDLSRELDMLRVALDDHVEEVEGADGLLAEVASIAPRLSDQVDRVQAEHPVLVGQVADAIQHLSDWEDSEAIRNEVLYVLISISRHRQSGADLVYRGYQVDIGSG